MLLECRVCGQGKDWQVIATLDHKTWKPVELAVCGECGYVQRLKRDASGLPFVPEPQPEQLPAVPVGITGVGTGLHTPHRVLAGEIGKAGGIGER